jgi:hypothetical protein
MISNHSCSRKPHTPPTVGAWHPFVKQQGFACTAVAASGSTWTRTAEKSPHTAHTFAEKSAKPRITAQPVQTSRTFHHGSCKYTPTAGNTPHKRGSVGKHVRQVRATHETHVSISLMDNSKTVLVFVTVRWGVIPLRPEGMQLVVSCNDNTNCANVCGAIHRVRLIPKLSAQLVHNTFGKFIVNLPSRTTNTAAKAVET